MLSYRKASTTLHSYQIRCRSTVHEIASHIGVTERTTHKVISNLINEGYIERRKDGRRNVYRVNPELPLRHHTKVEIMVSELIEALTAK